MTYKMRLCEVQCSVSRTIKHTCITDLCSSVSLGSSSTSRFLLINGGSSGLRPLSCTWVLDLSTASWTEVGTLKAHAQRELSHQLAQAEGRRAKAAGDEQVLPCARYAHSVTWFPSHRLIILLGGFDNLKRATAESGFAMHVPRENLSSREAWHGLGWLAVRWHPQSKLISKVASHRGHHTALLLAAEDGHARCLVFGGMQDENSSSPSSVANLFLVSASKLDSSMSSPVLATSEPRTTGVPPCERYGHAACILETGTVNNARRVMFVCGGIHPLTRAMLKDAYSLDLSSLADKNQPLMWTCIQLQSHVRLSPFAHHTACSVPAAGLPDGAVLLLWGAGPGGKVNSAPVKLKGKRSTLALVVEPYGRRGLSTPGLSQGMAKAVGWEDGETERREFAKGLTRISALSTPTTWSRSESTISEAVLSASDQPRPPLSIKNPAFLRAQSAMRDRTTLANALTATTAMHVSTQLLEKQMLPHSSSMEPAASMLRRPADVSSEGWRVSIRKVQGSAPAARMGHTVSPISLAVGSQQRQLHVVVVGGCDSSGRATLDAYTHVLDISLQDARPRLTPGPGSSPSSSFATGTTTECMDCGRQIRSQLGSMTNSELGAASGAARRRLAGEGGGTERSPDAALAGSGEHAHADCPTCGAVSARNVMERVSGGGGSAREGGGAGGDAAMSAECLSRVGRWADVKDAASADWSRQEGGGGGEALNQRSGWGLGGIGGRGTGMGGDSDFDVLHAGDIPLLPSSLSPVLLPR